MKTFESTREHVTHRLGMVNSPAVVVLLA
jgi:hypothetical protein